MMHSMPGFRILCLSLPATASQFNTPVTAHASDRVTSGFRMIEQAPHALGTQPCDLAYRCTELLRFRHSRCLCCSVPGFCINIMACFCITGIVVHSVIACQAAYEQCASCRWCFGAWQIMSQICPYMIKAPLMARERSCPAG